uniref:Uncharacterized protein n=1 Tax=Globodera rostochiensis TaxID=31243 RepID=A0A914HA24_GLORO
MRQRRMPKETNLSVDFPSIRRIGQTSMDNDEGTLKGVPLLLIAVEGQRHNSLQKADENGQHGRLPLENGLNTREMKIIID